MEAGARRAGLAGRTPKGLALCHLAKAEEKEVLLAAANKLAQCSVKLAPLRLVLLLGQLRQQKGSGEVYAVGLTRSEPHWEGVQMTGRVQ